LIAAILSLDWQRPPAVSAANPNLGFSASVWGRKPKFYFNKTYAVRGFVGRVAPHKSSNFLGFSHKVRQSYAKRELLN
jgi:hypothetical protein